MSMIAAIVYVGALLLALVCVDTLTKARTLRERTIALLESARWRAVADEQPEIGAVVMVWVLDRLKLDDPRDFGRPAFGYYTGGGTWHGFTVEGDPHAVVTHWRPAPEGPVNA